MWKFYNRFQINVNVECVDVKKYIFESVKLVHIMSVVYRAIPSIFTWNTVQDSV